MTIVAPSSLLNDRSRRATTSAIRDLLEHAQRPGMISLAGGLPDPAHFPTEELAAIAADVLRHDGRRTLQYGLTAGEGGTSNGTLPIDDTHLLPAAIHQAIANANANANA